MIPQLVRELEKQLKDTKFKHQFAMETLDRLEADIEQIEREMKDIERDIRRYSAEIDRTSMASIKYER